MAGTSGLPGAERGDSPGDYAIKLRLRLFTSQRAAAHHFGVEPGTISRYESEGITPPLGYLAALARLIVQRTVPAGEAAAAERFFVAELRRLATHFPDLYRLQEAPQDWDQLVRQADAYVRQREPGTPAAGAASPRAGPVPWPPGIPNDPYYPLPDREQSLSTLADTLTGRDGPAAVLIAGLGGIGKTALAAELARRVLQSGVFDQLLGDSAKHEVLAGGEIVAIRQAVLDYAQLVATLAGQLDAWEILTLPAAEQPLALARRLRAGRYLVVVDNLESAENARGLLARLPALLQGSRAIITGRQHLDAGSVRALTLTGLSPADSCAFLRSEAQARQVPRIGDLPQERLLEIHAITGGAPLALKLVVAQARYLALDAVLRQLRRAGSQLYPFLFRQSWEQLSPAARELLLYIGRTAVTAVSWEELTVDAPAGDEEELLRAVEQLVTWSLLDVATAPGPLRYDMHPLVRQFVTSDLPDRWAAGAP